MNFANLELLAQLKIWDHISKIDRDNEIQSFISDRHFALCTSLKRPKLAYFLRNRAQILYARLCL